VRQFARDLFFFAIVAWLVAGGTLAAQSRSALREKYGAPASETFIVRPGISVTTTFGANGRSTEFLIYPQDTGTLKFSRSNSLSMDSVRLIIDELVPPAVRGKHVISGFINGDCLPANDCNGTFDRYKKATIYYNAAAEGRVHYAVVRLKK
jgi:hypothetical protein